MIKLMEHFDQQDNPFTESVVKYEDGKWTARYRDESQKKDGETAVVERKFDGLLDAAAWLRHRIDVRNGCEAERGSDEVFVKRGPSMARWSLRMKRTDYRFERVSFYAGANYGEPGAADAQWRMDVWYKGPLGISYHIKRVPVGDLAAGMDWFQEEFGRGATRTYDELLYFDDKARLVRDAAAKPAYKRPSFLTHIIKYGESSFSSEAGDAGEVGVPVGPAELRPLAFADDAEFRLCNATVSAHHDLRAGTSGCTGTISWANRAEFAAGKQQYKRNAAIEYKETVQEAMDTVRKMPERFKDDAALEKYFGRR